jgi:hypothetical protein
VIEAQFRNIGGTVDPNLVIAGSDEVKSADTHEVGASSGTAINFKHCVPAGHRAAARALAYHCDAISAAQLNASS